MLGTPRIPTKTGHDYWVLACESWALTLWHETLRWLPGRWRVFHSDEAFKTAWLYEPAWRPDKCFSLHWHWLIPGGFTKDVECVGFHASDLPNFRGGSPIQNQLKRGITNTKLTAFRVDAGLDTGPIIAQMPLSLVGTRGEVLDRIAGLVARMMPRILIGAYEEKPQPMSGGSFYTRKDAEDYQWV